MDVPIWRAGKIKPKIREEQARQEAAQHAYQSAWDRTAAAIKDRFVTLQRLIPANPALWPGHRPPGPSGVRGLSGRLPDRHPDFARLTQNYIALYDAELKLQEYLKEFEGTWAELEWLVGQELPRQGAVK